MIGVYAVALEIKDVLVSNTAPKNTGYKIFAARGTKYHC